MTDYDDQNIFAKIMRGEMPCEKVYEDGATFAIMDVFPNADGHCLVMPKTPARNILDVDADALEAVGRTTQKLARAVMVAFDVDGVSIRQNNEPAGGQVVFHMHTHIMPRKAGERLRPSGGEMEKPEVLKANADKIRAALAAT